MTYPQIFANNEFQKNIGLHLRHWRLNSSELHFPLHLTFPLGLSFQGFRDRCFGAQFPVVENVLGVETDVLLRRLKKLGDFELGQLNALAFGTKIKPGAAIRKWHSG